MEADLHSLVGYVPPHLDNPSWRTCISDTSSTRCSGPSSTSTPPSSSIATSNPQISSSTANARVKLSLTQSRYAISASCAASLTKKIEKWYFLKKWLPAGTDPQRCYWALKHIPSRPTSGAWAALLPNWWSVSLFSQESRPWTSYRKFLSFLASLPNRISMLWRVKWPKLWLTSSMCAEDQLENTSEMLILQSKVWSSACLNSTQTKE